MKHAGGRPTKYTADKVTFVEEYIKRMQKENKLPVVQEVAYLLDVDDTTLVNWGNKHAKFFAAIKKLMAAQATMLQQGIYEDSKQHGAGGIFLLKNNHGFKDKTEQDITSGGKPIPLLGGTSVHPNNSAGEDPKAN